MSEDSLKILSPELPEKIIGMASAQGAVILVALYDCGVVNGCFDQEPWVQLLVAVPAEFNKNLSKGRNARRLHFRVTKDGEDLNFETNALGISQVSRELLLKLKIDESYRLGDTSKSDLKQWLAERYRQDTWPDAFNAAVKRRERQLKKLYKRYNEFVGGLYLHLHSYEELSGGKYTVSIILAIESGKLRALVKHIREARPEFSEKNIDAVLAILSNEVLAAFGDSVTFREDRTNLVHGVAIEVKEENNITLDDLRHFSRFSPYALSEFGTGNPLPAEMTPSKT
ncbi:hypothetical protein [Gilvimarinus sp. 1_MG-2023]|uniref:hypothetical protein n=1 Tax=Gilvimarinus sp. 1_MG-2023 TaxID=3062638 RepID=UPI0026E1BD5F|nr:hypothetical protein [Gilvimarinus sp. 1_MG-2023]MDO6747831.1 hypothetical protein [Gilvimarinus sp. 1_MG-2023]